MSASMAEVLEEHHISPLNEGGWACSSLECDFWDGSFEQAAAHQAEVLAAAGYGKLEDTTTEWGVRRDQDSAIWSRDAAERTIEQQRKRKLQPILIKRQVGPWEVAE